EMLQEVAARLVTATPRLSLNGNARAYLFRIAANVWRDHLRRELVRRRAAVVLESGEPRLADAADARLLERELRAAVRSAVDALHPRNARSSSSGTAASPSRRSPTGSASRSARCSRKCAPRSLVS